jgi:hypothetical protein
MNFLKKALSWLTTQDRYARLEQGQIEAYVDALAWIMASDRHIAAIERDEISRMIARFSLPTGVPGDHFVNTSLQRAWDVLGEDETRGWEYGREVGRRLGEGWLREDAYVACVRLVHADARVEPGEILALSQLAEGFRLDPELREDLEERAARVSVKASSAGEEE